MRRYFVTIVALVLTVSAMAFVKIENAKTLNYYWYHRVTPDTYIDDGFGSNPNTSCAGSGQICDKGFTTRQTASNIKDNTVANIQTMQSL